MSESLADIKWVKRDNTWPGFYELDETGPLIFGWDGEEGIYCDDESVLRLIKAAPALLEACKNFREWWANHFEDYDKESNGELLCLDNDFESAISLAEKEQ